MIINKVISICFSPNGSTNKIVKKLAKGIGCDNIEKINLTTLESRQEIREFKEDELIIIGFPVYADRLPSIANDIIQHLKGNNTLAVVVVSYGNRDYGDALLELKDRVEERDFKIVAGAAIIGEHCLNTNVAKGRPDEKDKLDIMEFAKTIKEKIDKIKDIREIKELNLKGNYPYRPLKSHHVPTGI